MAMTFQEFLQWLRGEPRTPRSPRAPKAPPAPKDDLTAVAPPPPGTPQP